MNRATQLALSRLNQRFYASIAADWQHKRKYAWPGFARISERCLAAAGGEMQRVLDVGCGDGRFAQYLHDRHHALDLAYLGVDNSPALLQAAARRQLAPTFRFEHADLVSELLQRGSFELIVVLGVLHHIPGRAQRSDFLRALAEQLRPAGHLVFTVWRLDEDPRFASRQVTLETYNRSATEPIDPAQLEPGDSLLRWGAQTETPRYCHFPDDAELAALIAATGLTICERYRADGHLNRMNEYVVLRAQ